jgi:OHCU decarboxylase
MNPRDEFIARFGGVFEHSPWIAEAAYDAGLPPDGDSTEGLHRAFCVAMRAAPRERQQALIEAHPDLAGRLSRAGGLTAASSAEQASAGLDSLTDDDFESFTALNTAYREKFAIPFVMAVKGRRADEILAAFEARLANDPETEFWTALMEIERIARLRIQEIIEP